MTFHFDTMNTFDPILTKELETIALTILHLNVISKPPPIFLEEKFFTFLVLLKGFLGRLKEKFETFCNWDKFCIDGVKETITSFKIDTTLFISTANFISLGETLKKVSQSIQDFGIMGEQKMGDVNIDFDEVPSLTAFKLDHTLRYVLSSSEAQLKSFNIFTQVTELSSTISRYQGIDFRVLNNDHNLFKNLQTRLQQLLALLKLEPIEWIQVIVREAELYLQKYDQPFSSLNLSLLSSPSPFNSSSSSSFTSTSSLQSSSSLVDFSPSSSFQIPSFFPNTSLPTFSPAFDESLSPRPLFPRSRLSESSLTSTFPYLAMRNTSLLSSASSSFSTSSLASESQTEKDSTSPVRKSGRHVKKTEKSIMQAKQEDDLPPYAPIRIGVNRNGALIQEDTVDFLGRINVYEVLKEGEEGKTYISVLEQGEKIGEHRNWFKTHRPIAGVYRAERYEGDNKSRNIAKSWFISLDTARQIKEYNSNKKK